MGIKTFLVKLGLMRNNKKDYSYLSSDVLSLVSQLDYDIFPMFGTLLSIHRDGKFLFADDFDFASFDAEMVSINFIEKVESLGANLHGFSLVNEEIIELSFLYKEAKIDFFLLKNESDKSVHLCPNFRTGKRKKEKENNVKYRLFDSYFKVVYPKIVLNFDNDINMLIPSEPVAIFEKHYGADWNVKKSKNFIDFSNYDFLDFPSYSYVGSSVNLIALMKSKGLIL